jgi:2-oxo-4-hydroxy-4-carboxy-5-ureidoimidazoline decarboxylase
MLKSGREHSSWALTAVNEMSQAQFVGVFGDIFEHTPAVAEAAWGRRPFPSREALAEAMGDVVRAWPPAQVKKLICAHPDLVGQLARQGGLTATSQHEQAAAGLASLSPAEAAQFDKWNRAYRAKFGFPFVICARLNRKAAIMEAFPRRLEQTEEEEVRTAVEEICQIARLRLEDRVTE